MRRINLLPAVLLFLALFASCKKDSHAPTITLIGNASVETGKGYPYVDAGATAYDEEDGDITSSIVIISDVDTGNIGTYHVRFNVKDSDGNAAGEVTREVVVKYFK